MTAETDSPAVAADRTACGECCDDFRVSRRTLLRGALGVGAATALFGTTFVQTSFAATATGRVLVVLSLRGAADGLSLVVPHGDPAYYAARPRIAIPPATLLAKDGFSACIRSWRRCCRCGGRARSPRCTRRACRCRTAPISRRWKPWRTPIRAAPPASAGSTGLSAAIRAAMCCAGSAWA